jgi:ubiquinone/menaquinone biosynthesis C-methylase UbiE
MTPQTPPADGHQVSEGFADAAAGYDTTGTEFFTTMGKNLVNHTEIPAGAWVLDAGCGKGAVTLPAARAAGPGGHVTGIDLAPGMLAHAEDRARRAGVTNVSFQAGDAEDPGTHPGWTAGSFDVILAGNVIQFLPRPAHAVRAWHRLLTPPGRVAISWSLAEDPRWLPVIAAFDTRMPEGRTGFVSTLRRPMFESVKTLHDMLIGCGYRHPDSVLHQVAMTYRSPAHWWEAASSQGPWAVAWRHLSPDSLQAAQRQAFALLDQLRHPDGTLTRTLTFACTSARKNPGPDPSPVTGDNR